VNESKEERKEKIQKKQDNALGKYKSINVFLVFISSFILNDLNTTV
jgi:hypothetical protein